jgi:DNA polymerase III subunit epsilon
MVTPMENVVPVAAADFSKPWKQYTYVAFDTETSGKYPLTAEIVEIAAVKWVGGQIAETYQTLVKPTRLMGQTVIDIHHITNEMVAGAPNIKDVLPAFDSFIKDSVLIAHHAAFDMGFLAYEYEKLEMALPLAMSLDSCVLGQRAYPQSVNHRLATLVGMLNIQMETAHRALDDSKACLEVAFACMEKLGANLTLDEIFKAQGGPFEWKRYSVKDLDAQEATHNLVEGCKKQLAMEIVYEAGSQPGVPRRITPQGLVRNPHGDFVVGLCHRENQEKRFYLHRVKSAKILD